MHEPGSVVWTLEAFWPQIRASGPFTSDRCLPSLCVSSAEEQGWDWDQGLLVAHHHLGRLFVVKGFDTMSTSPAQAIQAGHDLDEVPA